MNELFPHEFLAGIELLSLEVAAAVPLPTPGSHLSRSAGNSLDFRDFRKYSPGDDLRRVDWNVYRRSGHLFLRQYDHPTTAPIYILMDTSQSMHCEEPTRYALAARVTAAVAAAALRAHDRVSVIPFAAEPRQALLRIGGRRRLPEVLDFLSSLRPGGAGTLRAAARALREIARPEGIAVIVSDFFEEHDADEPVEALADVPHRLVLVQITQPWDSEPQLETECELLDCESARTVKVMPGSSVFSLYRSAYARYQAALDAFASRRASVFVRLDASADPLSQLGTLFPAGVLRIAEVRW